MNKGILVVVSGFSGAGKGTVMKRLMEKYDGYALSVSATTRKPRPGEEAEGMGQYDYILVNDTVEECVDHLHQIIVSEHSRVSRNAEFIADIQKQTKAFQK